MEPIEIKEAISEGEMSFLFEIPEEIAEGSPEGILTHIKEMEGKLAAESKGNGRSVTAYYGSSYSSGIFAQMEACAAEVSVTHRAMPPQNPVYPYLILTTDNMVGISACHPVMGIAKWTIWHMNMPTE